MLTGSEQLPYLKIISATFVTFATFQHEENLNLIERLVMWHNGFHMMLPQSLNNPGGKLSTPVDFWWDNNFNSFCTNNTEIFENQKVFVGFGGDFGGITPDKICK